VSEIHIYYKDDSTGEKALVKLRLEDGAFVSSWEVILYGIPLSA